MKHKEIFLTGDMILYHVDISLTIHILHAIITHEIFCHSTVDQRGRGQRKLV